MTPSANRPLLRGYFRPFQAVSNWGETDNLLIQLMKLPPVSLFHRFGGMLPVRFWSELAAPQNSEEPIPENHETVKQTAFYIAISNTYPFRPSLKQPGTVEQLRPKKVPAYAEH
jgi:hypothetical protein